ncbi:hypothetical protein BDN70DRAFT_427661 [Pholiota conissans]|uniref:DUF302 domain-containing protein n=1 Tax=Pholiota conissans TaxID=109636 RepID=A0A9P6D4A3_9AGAR|nr:hypothetical protein BDN70DRAFT_427661 [Pholiota conissans]
MNKTITEATIKLVQVDTIVPYSEVIARLDEEVNKTGSQNIIGSLMKTQTQGQFVAAVENTIKSDFLYFNEIPHHKLLRFDGATRPAIVVYYIGNPVIAQVILKHNPLAAYNIPPRLMIIEKPNGAGASLHYNLFSSVMGLRSGENPPELQEELDILDRKMDKLVTTITTPKFAA